LPGASPPVFHRGREHDLGSGPAKPLELPNELIQVDSAGKQHLDVHRVVAGDAVSGDYIGDGLDVRVKL